MRKRILMLSSVVALAACTPGRSADEAAISDTLMRMFDNPESRLTVGPVAVAGNAALADWTQGTLGACAVGARSRCASVPNRSRRP